MWRLRMKREWIREQLRALRGFPPDADHASCEEPWDEAFGEAPVPSHASPCSCATQTEPLCGQHSYSASY